MASSVLDADGTAELRWHLRVGGARPGPGDEPAAVVPPRPEAADSVANGDRRG